MDPDRPSALSMLARRISWRIEELGHINQLIVLFFALSIILIWVFRRRLNISAFKLTLFAAIIFMTGLMRSMILIADLYKGPIGYNKFSLDELIPKALWILICYIFLSIVTLFTGFCYSLFFPIVKKQKHVEAAVVTAGIDSQE